MKSFNYNETKYKNVFTIIDNRWTYINFIAHCMLLVTF